MGDLHQKSTAEASAQDIACSSFLEQITNDPNLAGPNDVDEIHDVGEAEMISKDGEIVEADGGLSAEERAALERFYDKRSSRFYRPVLTPAHAYPYTDQLKRRARQLVELGYHVLPCRPLIFTDENGNEWNPKEPLTKRGFYDATDDVNQIERWWHPSKYPDAMIGVRTGLKGGFWVLDPDVPKLRKDGTMTADGVAELKKLEAKFGPLPETYTVKTPSGGYHYYFKMPDGIKIGCSAGKVAPGVDVRAEGGYVIVPPSMSADGHAYEVVDNGFLLAQCAWAPDWLIKLTISGSNEKARQKIASRGWAYRYLARKCEEVTKTDEGGRNQTLNTAAFLVGKLVSRGLLARDVAFDAFWDAAKRAGLAEDESRKTINSGLNGSAKLLVDEPPFPDWTKYGPRRDSLDNVRALLAHLNIELRYNEFASRAEITGFKSYAILNDNVVDELWGQCNEFGFQPSQNHLRNSLRTIALENSFHPVRDYFDNLEWDGQKRLDTWLTNYLGAEDSKYTRSVSAKTLIAAARRIYEPGTKFDQIVVLEGIQGTEKSSALELLAIKKAWFTDDFSLTDDSRKILEQTEGKLIVESSELIGGRRADANHIKAMLSRTHDRARKAYGYFVTEVPRQFIFIGTTNEKKYLVDPTGNRRFWPVQTDRIDTKGLKSDVDQLWAEAVHRHRQGESIVLPKELWEAARQEQEKRTFEDPWRLALEDVLGNVNGKVPTSDVWTLIGKPTPKDRTQYDNNHLGEVMRELGWTRTKLQYKKKLQNCYVRGVEPHPEISIQSTPFGQPSVQVAKEQPNDEHREY